MSYLGMSFPNPDEVLPNNKYISIVVPAYCRPFYLSKLLDTLEKTADMMYEVIVNDDGSPPHIQEELFKMRDRVSTLILNTGMNMGLCAASNRAIKLATSKYILFLNDDCFFTERCLQDICAVLDKPYVGLVSPMNDVGKLSDAEGVCTVGNGTRFALSNFLGGGSTMAFRKEVWEEVGGFNEWSTSGQADNVFVYSILKAGYWKALIEGPDRVKVGNFVYPAWDSGLPDAYQPTQPFSNGNDCSFPKIFGMDKPTWLKLNWLRRSANQYWVDSQRTIPNRETYDNRPNPIAGLNDIPYWGEHFLAMFGGRHSSDIRLVDWNVASIHGQNRWRSEIEKDFSL